DMIPEGAITVANSQGDSVQWIVTDAQNNILGLPPTFSAVDFDGAGAGTCLVWYLRYNGAIQGLAMDANLDDLTGCFDLSNAVSVVRNPATGNVDGGAITLADGSTETSICVDVNGDPLEVVRDGNGTGPNREFVITDDQGNILDLPGAGANGPFDLNGAGVGICEIWYLAYADGLTGLAVGNNLSDLDGTHDLSNAITVVRQAPDGGRVTTAAGDTTVTATAGNVIVAVSHTTTATALSYWYIITDANDNILEFANSADTDMLDLSAAPPGECHIWGWSYRGEGDPVMGDNISSLTDGDCEAISDNFIRVIREEDTDGFQFKEVIINEVAADGRIELFNGTDEAVDVSDYWLCNFPAYTRIGTLTVECGELLIQPGEVTVVSGFNGFDAVDAELGLYTTNSFGSSNAIISYLEWGSTGHRRSNVAIAAGVWADGQVVDAPTATQSQQVMVNDNDELAWALGDPSLCAPNSLTNPTDGPTNLAEVMIFPNPVTDFLNVEVSGMTGPESMIEIF
ncbi:MAG: hypothetical protein AAFN92_17125, partial [Bacteroidota bacterium]